MKTPKIVSDACDAIERELVDLVKSTREGLLAKSGDLAKVHPGEETPAETSPDDTAISPAPDGDGAPPPAPEGASPEAPGAEEIPGEGGEAPPSHEQMISILQSLPHEQLEAWKAALDEVWSAQEGQEATAGASPDAASPTPPSAGPPPDAMKAELDQAAAVLAKAEVALKAKDTDISKLQAQMKTTEEKLAKQEKDLKEAAELIAGYLRQPNRRGSVAPASVADPLAGLSKSELDATLRQIARNPRLSPAQREALDAFSFYGERADEVRALIVGAKQ